MHVWCQVPNFVSQVPNSVSRMQNFVSRVTNFVSRCPILSVGQNVPGKMSRCVKFTVQKVQVW